MAGIIPEFQRQQLKSQQVGTAGTDLSTARAFSSAAGASGKIAQAGFRKEKQEAQVKAAESKALAKTQAENDKLLKSSVTDSNNAVRMIGLNTEISRLRNDAGGDVDAYNKSVGELLQERVGEIEDVNERADFSKQASSLVISSQKKASDQFRKEGVNKITTNLDVITDKASEDIHETFSNTEMSYDEKVQTYKDTVEFNQNIIEAHGEVLGAEATVKQQEADRVKQTRTAIEALIDSSPERVEEFIKSIGDTLPKDEVQEFREYATKVAKSKEAELEAFEVEEADTIGQDLANRIAVEEDISEKELAILELTNPKTTKMVAAVRRYKASEKKHKAENNPTRVLDLTNELNLMTKKTKRKGLVITKGTTFEQLASFRAAVVDARADGDITASQAKTWTALTAPKFGETIDEMFENINEVTTDVGTLWDTTEDILTDDAEIAEAKVRLQSEFIDSVVAEETKLNRRLRPTEITDMREQLEEDFVVRVVPARTKFKLGKIYTLKGTNYRVVGYRKDGAPMLEDDLSVSVQDAPRPK